jgi:hypothetical protein
MRVFRRLVVVLALIGMAGTSRVRAEGSAELDARDNLADHDEHDQVLQEDTPLQVDILNPGGDPERICWDGKGNLAVFLPGDEPEADAAWIELTPGTCMLEELSETGVYPLRVLETQELGTEWDIRVCGATGDCLGDDDNERLGRLWSKAWHFNADEYVEGRSIDASVYAIVPGGAADRDAVIEMSMEGVSGRDYRVFANSVGPRKLGGARVGRSTLAADHEVEPGFPIYINPPEAAGYDWIEPVVSRVEVSPSCGSGVVLDSSPGSIGFRSNVEGQYVVICDLDADGIFDFASSDDFSSFGDAEVGVNTAEWDGTTNGGQNVEPGDYECVIRLNVGEFHFIADDIETSFPGFRMYRLDADRSTRTPIRMFWDDAAVPTDPQSMPNGEAAADAPEADGLDPGSIDDPPSAFYYDGDGAPHGNARAWGEFDYDGKGNDVFLDTFAAADSVTSTPLVIAVVSRDGDSDADGLKNGRECELGADPENEDSDGDGVRDGFEASATAAPDHDGDDTIDVLDDDDDGDGIATADEGPDQDGDGDPEDALNSDAADDLPDYLDSDSDDDGFSDRNEDAGDGDLDDDGVHDAREPNVYPGDADDDGDPDFRERPDGEAIDSDDDGMPDAMDEDDDNDGVPTAIERPDGEDRDSDQDGTPDHLDPDDDGDGILTATEVDDGAELDGEGDGQDVDGDGIPNYRDLDSDGDGQGDARESVKDRNGDGIPDYLHANKAPALAGGAMCAVSSALGAEADNRWLGWLSLAPAAVLLGRRRSRRQGAGG